MKVNPRLCGGWLSAEHIPGSKNVLADQASRIFDENTEWQLNDCVFNEINPNFGEFEIDLFASRLKEKVKNYASWKPDPNAQFIDAFSSSWESFAFYAFPPFSMIMKCIEFIIL